MKPSPAWEGKLAKVDRFIQRTPSDGEPPHSAPTPILAMTTRTCTRFSFASITSRRRVRARLSHREDVFDDDDGRGDARYLPRSSPRRMLFSPMRWESRLTLCGPRARSSILLSIRSSTPRPNSRRKASSSRWLSPFAVCALPPTIRRPGESCSTGTSSATMKKRHSGPSIPAASQAD